MNKKAECEKFCRSGTTSGFKYGPQASAQECMRNMTERFDMVVLDLKTRQYKENIQEDRILGRQEYVAIGVPI
jgi:hypothetical protein